VTEGENLMLQILREVRADIRAGFADVRSDIKSGFANVASDEMEGAIEATQIAELAGGENDNYDIARYDMHYYWRQAAELMVRYYAAYEAMILQTRRGAD
jgi:hypothetical protein